MCHLGRSQLGCSHTLTTTDRPKLAMTCSTAAVIDHLLSGGFCLTASDDKVYGARRPDLGACCQRGRGGVGASSRIWRALQCQWS